MRMISYFDVSAVSIAPDVNLSFDGPATTPNVSFSYLVIDPSNSLTVEGPNNNNFG